MQQTVFRPDKTDRQEQATNPVIHYYLFDFSNHELLGILKHPDQYSPFDLELAEWLLQERGKGLYRFDLDMETTSTTQPSLSVKYMKGRAYINAVFNLFTVLPKTATRILGSSK
jgi:hypothetical protein